MIDPIAVGNRKFYPEVMVSVDGKMMSNPELPENERITITFRNATERERLKWTNFKQVTKGEDVETEFLIDRVDAVNKAVILIENLKIVEKGKVVDVTDGALLTRYESSNPILVDIFRQTYEHIMGSGGEDFLV